MTKSTLGENKNKTPQSLDHKIMYCAGSDLLDISQIKSNSL